MNRIRNLGTVHSVGAESCSARVRAVSPTGVSHQSVAKLGDHVEILSGFAFDSEGFSTDTGIPIIRIRDVVPGASSTFYTGPYDERYVISNGDILIGMDGEFNRARWKGGKALLNQRVCRISTKSPILDSGYLFHFLPDALKAIERVTSFVTVKHLSVKDIREIAIPLPPLAEQKRIAAILDAADALRAQRRRALARLDDLARSLFLHHFGDPVSNPKGWPVVALTDLCHCYSGGTPSKSNKELWDGSLPWFSAKDLKQDDLFDAQDHISERVTEETNLKLLPRNTVTIVVRGMILAHTFPVSVLRIPSTINQDLKALLPRREIEPQYLAGSLRAQAKHIIESKVSVASHGTKKLSTEDLEQIQIPLPPLALQQRFARELALLEAQKSRQRAHLAQLVALFASLQSRAFTGGL